MATHSSVLAWRIPGTGSLVGCRLWGRTESDTTEVTQQQQQWPISAPTPFILTYINNFGMEWLLRNYDHSFFEKGDSLVSGS